MQNLSWALWRASLLASLVVTLSFLAMAAKADQDETSAFWSEVHAARVIAPREAPLVSQESIDIALVMFGIVVPMTAHHPELDRGLTDRGLTTRKALADKVEVKIGPAAFTSWGLLGSTLAHELEVHARQNFFSIYLMDLVGLDGTGEAERQAYLHELRNAKRFGLISADAELIEQTMAYYYPEPRHVAARVTQDLRLWLARNFIKSDVVATH